MVSTCANPIPLAAGVTVNGTNVGAANNQRFLNSNSTCSPTLASSTAGEVIYSITVPPLSRLTVTLRAAFDSTLNILANAAACGPLDGPSTCLARADEIGTGVVETATVTTGSSGASFLVAVDGYGASDVGAFTITALVAPIGPGETCAQAESVTLPLTRSAESTVGYTNDAVGSGFACPSRTNGPDRMYRFIIPANHRLTASILVSGASGFLPSLSLLNGTLCGTTGLACLAGIDSAGQPATGTLTYDNAGAAREVTLIVDAAAGLSGVFDLSISSAPVSLPLGDVCENAPLTGSTMLPSESLNGFLGQYSAAGSVPSCRYLPGVDRAYAISVPQGQVLTASASTGDGGVDLSLSVVLPSNLCSQGPCALSSNQVIGGTETVRYANPGATQTVFLVVDSNVSAGTPATYALTVNVAPPPAGDICDDAQPAITASQSLGMETLAGFSDDYDGTFCAYSPEEERVYRIEVPANFRLTATTVTTADHALSLIGGPAANCGAQQQCLAQVDQVTTGGGETITWANNSPTVRSVFLVVDRYDTSGTPEFGLTIDLTALPPPAYNRTLVPQACGTLGAGAVPLISNITDDAVSVVQPLGMPFSFFSTPVDGFGVSTNGSLQFFADGGTVRNTFTNVAIPNNAPPNGHAAVFWDDLIAPNAGDAGVPSIRSELTGVAPNRTLTVEWRNLSIRAAGGVYSDQLTFQAKLFETSNVVEFHYCALVQGTSPLATVTGGTATIGLENFLGTEGVQHSFNQASAVDTANALRFTP